MDLFHKVMEAVRRADSVRLVDTYGMFDCTDLPDGSVILSFSNNRGQTFMAQLDSKASFRIHDNVIDFETEDKELSGTLHLYMKAIIQ